MSLHLLLMLSFEMLGVLTLENSSCTGYGLNVERSGWVCICIISTAALKNWGLVIEMRHKLRRNAGRKWPCGSICVHFQLDVSWSNARSVSVDVVYSAQLCFHSLGSLSLMLDSSVLVLSYSISTCRNFAYESMCYLKFALWPLRIR